MNLNKETVIVIVLVVLFITDFILFRVLFPMMVSSSSDILVWLGVMGSFGTIAFQFWLVYLASKKG
jgi:hypothetical protein